MNGCLFVCLLLGTIGSFCRPCLFFNHPPTDTLIHCVFSIACSLLYFADAVWEDCIPYVVPLMYPDVTNVTNAVYHWTPPNNDNTSASTSFHKSCIRVCSWDVVFVRHHVWSKCVLPIVPMPKNVPDNVDVRHGRVAGLRIYYGRVLSGRV